MSWYSFRAGHEIDYSFALTLLKEYFSEQNLEISEQFGPFDALVLGDFKNLKGPIGVVLSRRTFQRAIEIFRFARKYDVASGLIILTGKERSPPYKSIERSANEILGESFPLIVWGYGKLNRMAEELKIAPKGSLKVFPELNVRLALADRLRNRRIEEAVEKVEKGVSDEWKERCAKHVKELNEEYKKRGIILFLGAGVSKPAGIPLWQSLLSDLRLALIDDKLSKYGIKATEDQKRSLSEAFPGLLGPDPLLSALYARTGLKDRFEKILTHILYRKIGSHGLTLEAIANLCKSSEKEGGVKSVLTHNYDDLLERELNKQRVKFQSICQEGMEPKQDEIGIYHVHGFLPENPESYKLPCNVPLVLSEEDYHTLYEDPYGWANITQFNFLHNCTCLMIGHSLTDPNLRRLLRLMARRLGTPWHYVCFAREAPIDAAGIPREPTDIERNYLNTHHEIEEEAFKELKIRIIWYRSHEDIPKILRCIRTGDNYTF